MDEQIYETEVMSNEAEKAYDLALLEEDSNGKGDFVAGSLVGLATAGVIALGIKGFKKLKARREAKKLELEEKLDEYVEAEVIEPEIQESKPEKKTKK